MESFEKIQRYGSEREQALALAEDRLLRILELIPEARAEGYSMESIAKHSAVTRQALYNRMKEEA